MKFKPGDEVVVVSYKGILIHEGVIKEYGITKLGFVGIIQSVHGKHIFLNVPNFKQHLGVYIEDIELTELSKSPLWKALS